MGAANDAQKNAHIIAHNAPDPDGKASSNQPEKFEKRRNVEVMKARLSRYSLLTYAARRWYQHIQRSRYSRDEFFREVLPHLSWFLKMEPQFLSWQEVYTYQCRSYHNLQRDQPAFFYALFFGLNYCCQLLLLQQHDINHHFRGGWTPLTVAVRSHSLETVRILLDAGADVNRSASKFHKELTALHLAAEQADRYIFDLLLSAGASIHARTTSGTTPFYRAVRGGDIYILIRLFEAGSEVNVLTWDRCSPLIEAVGNYDLRAVRYLLSIGANPSLETLHGDNALDFARIGISNGAPQSKVNQIIDCLIEHDPELRSKSRLYERRTPS